MAIGSLRLSNTWQLLALLAALNCLLLGVALGQEDFYELLKVSRDADTAAIKKAFRKASLEYHPDKNPGKLASVRPFSCSAYYS